MEKSDLMHSVVGFNKFFG